MKGKYKDGKRTFISNLGEKYVGELKDGLPNGQGEFIDSNGEKYVGEFKDGKKNGQGLWIQENGDRYSGFFKNGSIWSGSRSNKKGRIIQEWLNGELQ